MAHDMNPRDDEPIDREDYERWEREQLKCQTCKGEGVVMVNPPGAGHTDDLAEYVPCPECSQVRP